MQPYSNDCIKCRAGLAGLVILRYFGLLTYGLHQPSDKVVEAPLVNAHHKHHLYLVTAEDSDCHHAKKEVVAQGWQNHTCLA